MVATREPGGSPGAEAIRDLLVTGEADRWSPITETLLMYAARRDQSSARSARRWRAAPGWSATASPTSTRAYQGAGGGAPRR